MSTDDRRAGPRAGAGGRLRSMRRRRWLLLLLLYLGLIVGGWLGGQWLLEQVGPDIRPSDEPLVHAMIMSAFGAYIVESAIPFVPGAEIGIGLVIVLGTKVVILVYLSMVAALSLTYLVGRFVPASATAAALHFFGLGKAHELVLRMAPLDAKARLALLTDRAPRRVIPVLLRHRYLALAVLLNLPGNSLVGGGGGIALAAGMSGLYPLPAYLATVALAVAPLPLFILLTGHGS